ncbi:MAG TPA: hypothetical protein VE218_13830 [Acidobacteriaceae bacterium]|nr:hypothetical protein [Acidobacteriaceae bacterium]
MRVCTVLLRDGVTPSAQRWATIKLQILYRNSNQLRFIVRDEASGHVGSSESRLAPS